MGRATAWILVPAIFLGIGFILGSEFGGRQDPGSSGLPSPCAPKTVHQLVVYYFHPADRSEACVRMQARAEHVIRTTFPGHVAGERIVFFSSNMDEVWNRDFVERYGLDSSSLVLVNTFDGRELDHAVLKRLGELIEEPEALREYVRSEVIAAMERGEAAIDG